MNKNIKLKRFGNSGWHLESMRHSNARRFGSAGPSLKSPHSTPNYMRHRVLDPKHFDNNSYHTINADPNGNTKVVVATNRHNNQRMVQSIIVKKSAPESAHTAAAEEAKSLHDSAYKDSDRDGVSNALDCEPNNPKKQGFTHFILKKIRAKKKKEKEDDLESYTKAGFKDLESKRKAQEAAAKRKGWRGVSEAHKAAAKGIKVNKLLREYDDAKGALILEHEQPRPNPNAIIRLQNIVQRKWDTYKSERNALAKLKAGAITRVRRQAITKKAVAKEARKHRELLSKDTVSGDIAEGLHSLRFD